MDQEKIKVPSNRKAFRASLLDFDSDVLDNPHSPQIVKDHLRFVEDGMLIVEDGKITYSGSFCDGENQLQKDDELLDFRGKIITPGFIDTHIHFPQMEMICAYGEQLLEWLSAYTFPTEAKYKSITYAKEKALMFLNELFRNGTTTAVVFCTVHPESVEALFTAAQQHNMLIIAGKVMMDRNAPDYLLDTPETSYTQSKELIEKYHGSGRCLYAITPRFVPTSTQAQLALAGKLKAEYPDVFVHTHLAENKNEVAWVAELFPDARSYFDVYEKNGLTGRRCVFAHCIHMDEEDMRCFGSSKSVLSFCPTSNLFLGSGLLPISKLCEHNILMTLGTDVGAGTSFSLMQTFQEAYKVSQLRGGRLSVEQGIFWATLGAAHALELAGSIGNLDAGKDADFVVLDPVATQLQQLRWDTATTLSDRLFTLFMIGDDRNIYRTYIHGTQVFARSR